MAHLNADPYIASLKDRLTAVETIKDIDERYPGLIEELLGIKPGQVNATQQNGTPRKRRRSEPTVFERVEVFFEGNGNDWSKIEQIARGTKLPAKAIREVFYRRFKDRIEKQRRSDGVFWRLKK